MISEAPVFIRELLKGEPVCSVMPTSVFAIRKICRTIPRDRPICMVEYGPGTGAFTRHLSKHLHRDSIILAIEINRTLFNELTSRDHTEESGCQTILANESCMNVLEIQRRYKLPPFDFVLSGVPFSIMAANDQDKILRYTYGAMRIGGEGLFYQTTFALEQQLMRQFGSVTREYSVLNIPPLAILRVQKPISASSVRLESNFTNGNLAFAGAC